MLVDPQDGRCRSCEGSLEITDDDDATMTPAIYLVYASNAGLSSSTEVMYDVKLASALPSVLRALRSALPAVMNATASDFYFGTLGALTNSTWATSVLSYIGGNASRYSSDNERGEIFISDLANAEGLIIRFTLGTATSANAEIRLDN